MAKNFAGGHLCYAAGRWRDDNGTPVDVVAVIRCWRCGWYNRANLTCKFWPDEGYRAPDHFCGKGKAREDHE